MNHNPLPTPEENKSDTDPSRVELLTEKNQRLISYGAILGSVMLAAQHVTVATHLHRWVAVTVSSLSLLGWCIFLVGMVRAIRLKKSPEGKAFMEHTAKDERLLSIRAGAFTSGFVAMLGMQVLLIFLWMAFGHTEAEWLSIPVAAPATIAAGVTAAILHFQTLSNR